MPRATASEPTRVLGEAEWRARRHDHERRVAGWLTGDLERRRRNGRHSIEDFLFTYYTYRPAQLRRWYPGLGVALDGARIEEFGAPHRLDPDGRVVLDTAAVLRRRGESVRRIQRLLLATAGRPAHLGCFGMHEWAMVYRQPDASLGSGGAAGPAAQIRHNLLPLRLGAAATSALVDEIRVRCTHYDAFRFFTPPARPLNALRPTRENQVDLEQPGCLHANMDLYRWAYKLAPLTPSELVADCFALARDVRTLDIRASPYDLTGLGLSPVPVETPDGRAQYVREQRGFAERAATLRAALIGLCDRAWGTFPAGQPTKGA